MPIQHTPSLRRRYPALHRWSGRACFLSGLVLNVSGLLIVYKKLSYSAPFWMSRQCLRIHERSLKADVSPILGTAQVGSVALSVVQLVHLPHRLDLAAAPDTSLPHCKSKAFRRAQTLGYVLHRRGSVTSHLC